MSNPTTEKWIINNAPGQAPPQAVGNHLDGYIIKETASHFELHGKLASVNKPAPNQPFTFQNVTIDGLSWDIQVDALPSTTDAGTWTTPSAFALKYGDTTPTSGEFTAQTDGGDVGEDAAASAAHGN